MRIAFVFMVAIAGLCQLASGATISATFNAGFLIPNPPTYSGNYPGKLSDLGLGSPDIYFGSVQSYNDASAAIQTPVSDSRVVVAGDDEFRIRTDVRREQTSATKFYLTSYATHNLRTGAATAGKVFNSGFWEFTINGVYNWRIEAQGTVGAVESRPYSFVKVVGGVDQSIFSSNGTNDTFQDGVVSLTSGVYRLYYQHSDSDIYTWSAPPAPSPNTAVNSRNLDIRFSFVSEDNSGVVPEPSSVAVFGVLGLGSFLAKCRRKK